MRPRKPWYRASKEKWYVESEGRKVPLGTHPVGAPPPKKGKNGWNAPPEIMLNVTVSCVLRTAAIRRKQTFGSDSACGREYVARLYGVAPARRLRAGLPDGGRQGASSRLACSCSTFCHLNGYPALWGADHEPSAVGLAFRCSHGWPLGR